MLSNVTKYSYIVCPRPFSQIVLQHNIFFKEYKLVYDVSSAFREIVKNAITYSHKVLPCALFASFYEVDGNHLTF